MTTKMILKNQLEKNQTKCNISSPLISNNALDIGFNETRLFDLMCNCDYASFTIFVFTFNHLAWLILNKIIMWYQFSFTEDKNAYR